MYQGTHSRMFAEYNRWMNEKLYDAAARLSDEERKRDLKAFFKSLHGTLDHLVMVDSIWLARFSGATVSPPKFGTIQFDDFDALRQERASLDARLVEWAGGVTDEWLSRPWTFTSVMYQRTFTHPTWVLVAQMWNHQTHHRGQATTLLMQFGVDPGVTDIPMLPILNV